MCITGKKVNWDMFSTGKYGTLQYPKECISPWDPRLQKFIPRKQIDKIVHWNLVYNIYPFNIHFHLSVFSIFPIMIFGGIFNSKRNGTSLTSIIITLFSLVGRPRQEMLFYLVNVTLGTS